MALTKVKGHIIADDLALGGNPTTSTQSTGNNTTRLATTAFVQTEISALADSAPSALNTLNELAAAMGDDANFSTTVTNSIATKLPLAGGTMTGNLTVNAIVDADNFKINNAQGTDGQVLTSTGSGVAWEAVPAGGVAGIVTSANATAITIDSSENVSLAGTYQANPSLSVTPIATIDQRWSAGSAKGNLINAIVGVSNGFQTLQDTSNNLVYNFYHGANGGVTHFGAGNVGIGTTSPTFTASSFKGIEVEVSGDLFPNVRLERVSGSSKTNQAYEMVIGSGGNWHVRNATTASAPLSIATDDSIHMTGHLGIGVAPSSSWHADATALQISPIGAIWNTSNYEDFNIGNNVYTDGTEKYIQNDAACKIRLTDAGLMDFRVAGAGTAGNAISWVTALVIASDGKVGIGTTSFAADGSSTLQVAGRLGVMENTGTQLQMSTGSTYSWMEAWDNTSDRAPKRPICFNPWGGLVGIGTTAPTDPLTIHHGTPGIAFKDTSSNGEAFWQLDGTQVKFVNKSSAGEMMFGTVNARRMSISQYGALHIDSNSGYSNKNWVNENTASSPQGGTGASGNTYQKLRLWVDGDINLNQGRGLHFGDVTNNAPLCIREGKPSEHGTDKDKLEIWGRGQITLTSERGGIATGDTSAAGTARSSSFYIKKTGQMGGTWTEVITTPNGGDQTCRVFEDWTGRWVMVGRFAADARVSITGTWSSVSGLSTAVAQTTATAFSADWGDAYPSEVRIMGCTDIDEYMDTRTIDFIYGNRPSGAHAYTPRQWKHFFAGQNADGMTQNAGWANKFGFATGYTYDGKGRWYNPIMVGMGMSDGQVTNPRAAYTTATSNAFNWNTAADAKLITTHYRTTAKQDDHETTGFGTDDNTPGFFDSYPTEYNNMGGGVTGGGVHATLTSAVFILIKLNW